MPPKGKGKGKGVKINFGKGRIDDELDAYDYAEEDAAYQRWEETQVKENKLEASTSKKMDDLWEKPFVPLAVREEQAAKAAEEAKEKQEEQEEQEEAKWEKEVELELFDNWEDAMDALDAHISKQEEIKADSAAKGEKPKAKGK